MAQDQKAIQELAADLEEDESDNSDSEDEEVPDVWDSDEDMIEPDDDFEVDDEDW